MSIPNKHDEAKLLSFQGCFLNSNEALLKRPCECQATYMELYPGPFWHPRGPWRITCLVSRPFAWQGLSVCLSNHLFKLHTPLGQVLAYRL